jgi:hypothetical protein
MKNKISQLEDASKYCNLLKNETKLIFAEVEIAVKN